MTESVKYILKAVKKNGPPDGDPLHIQSSS